MTNCSLFTTLENIMDHFCNLAVNSLLLYHRTVLEYEKREKYKKCRNYVVTGQRTELITHPQSVSCENNILLVLFMMLLLACFKE